MTLPSTQMQSIQEKIEERIKSTFMELLPDEMFANLVKKQIEDLLAQKSSWNNSELPKSELQKMVENDVYCIDVITQTSASKQGLSNVEDMLLENHLGHCVILQVQSGETKKAKEEIIKVYKLKRK